MQHKHAAPGGTSHDYQPGAAAFIQKDYNPLEHYPYSAHEYVFITYLYMDIWHELKDCAIMQASKSYRSTPAANRPFCPDRMGYRDYTVSDPEEREAVRRLPRVFSDLRPFLYANLAPKTATPPSFLFLLTWSLNGANGHASTIPHVPLDINLQKVRRYQWYRLFQEISASGATGKLARFAAAMPA